MDSPVDSLGLVDDLGFLDSIFSQEPAPEQNLDLSYLLNADPLPANRGSAQDREELLRAALRSHQEANMVTAAGPEAHAPHRLPTDHQVDNNAAACAPAVAAAPAIAAAGSTAAQPSQSSVPSVAVKPEPMQQQEQHSYYDDQFETDSDAVHTKGGNKGATVKRRRRIRNAKQQELNRLAQQRYRERKKQKYSNLQGTVDELSMRLSQLSTLEAANSELQQRNGQLETVVKQQQTQLQQQQETISRQAQQLQTQAQQLHRQAQQLQSQVQHIEQQDKQMAEIRRQLATQQQQQQIVPSDAEQLNDQLALAVRAVLTGVSTMTSMIPAKDAQQMQQMVTTLPESILQQIRSCCREVALHLKKTEVKEQPHAIQVPCC